MMHFIPLYCLSCNVQDLIALINWQGAPDFHSIVCSIHSLWGHKEIDSALTSCWWYVLEPWHCEVQWVISTHHLCAVSWKAVCFLCDEMDTPSRRDPWLPYLSVVSSPPPPLVSLLHQIHVSICGLDHVPFVKWAFLLKSSDDIIRLHNSYHCWGQFICMIGENLEVQSFVPYSPMWTQCLFIHSISLMTQWMRRDYVYWI